MVTIFFHKMQACILTINWALLLVGSFMVSTFALPSTSNKNFNVNSKMNSAFVPCTRRPAKISAKHKTMKAVESDEVNAKDISQNDIRMSNNNPQKMDNLTKDKSTKPLSGDRHQPLISIGVIADIQHAPIPDGHSFSGTPRYYRHALRVAGIAAKHFEKSKVDLVLNLGDIIDGKCTTENIRNTENTVVPINNVEAIEAVENVNKALNVYTNGPILHTYGNHELYNLSREVIGKMLNIPFVLESDDDLVGYRSYVKNKIRFVVLDTYDICMMGRCPNTSHKRKQAEQILAKNNPNYPENENSPQFLKGLDMRFVAFNGGVGNTQLSWLRETLTNSRRNGERVIVMSHQPILPGSTSPVCLIWNYEEILNILREFSGVVIASFSGHAHKGGYQRDPLSGIHFRVFEAALESPFPVQTYAHVDIYSNEIIVRGEGDCKSAVYDCSHLDIASSKPISTAMDWKTANAKTL